MTPDEAVRQSLYNLALRLTSSRGGYVGGGQPHATIPSDSGAVEEFVKSLTARLAAARFPEPGVHLGDEGLRAALIQEHVLLRGPAHDLSTGGYYATGQLNCDICALLRLALATPAEGEDR